MRFAAITAILGSFCCVILSINDKNFEAMFGWVTAIIWQVNYLYNYKR